MILGSITGALNALIKVLKSQFEVTTPPLVPLVVPALLTSIRYHAKEVWDTFVCLHSFSIPQFSSKVFITGHLNEEWVKSRKCSVRGQRSLYIDVS